MKLATQKRLPMLPSRGRDCTVGKTLAALLCSLCVSISLAAEPNAIATRELGGHLHEPLPASSALRWPEVIETTVVNFPGFIELAARSDEAAAFNQRARTWLSGPTSIFLALQSDRALDNQDLREYEAGFQLPLWRPGQREAARLLGVAANSETEAARAALRHEVIGLLRLALWDIKRAEIAMGLAEDQVAAAAERLRVVERRYAAGDLPLTDTMLARSAMMEREVAVVNAEAELLDAERAYRSLTGLDARPADFAESLSSREDLEASHPLLALADTEVSRYQATRDLVDKSALGMPQLTIGTRRQRDPFSSFFTDSLGVGVSVPFGGRSHRNAQVATAGRTVAQAQAARASVHRELDLELHEAEHTLSVVNESLALAQERRALAARHLEMSEMAFAQGEIPLFELLRQDETAMMAERDVARLEVDLQRAIALINQAVGEWP